MRMRLLAAPALFIALVAACGQGDDMPATDTATMAAPAPAAPALDDATIVAIFDETNTADIETGQLAVEKGSTKEVRDFGAMMVRDHGAVRQQGRDLAAKLGVTPTPPADNASAQAHADAMATLGALSGVEFDKAYLDHEIAFHQAVIDAINNTLMPAIQNAEVRQLVTDVAPAFEAHRVAAVQLREKIGG
jgi:putative membrane protein